MRYLKETRPPRRIRRERRCPLRVVLLGRRGAAEVRE
jgi:hypothetical protein